MAVKAKPSSGKTLVFGFVNVPIKLHPAQRAQAVKFRNLTPDGNPMRQSEEIFDSITGNAFPKDQIHKGYEFVKGRFVEVTPAMIEEAIPAKSGVIEIELFVPAYELPPVRIEKAYWLTPDQGGERAYALLLEGLQSKKMVGIAQMVSHDRQHLSAILPMANPGDGQPMLALCTLYYDDEVLAPPQSPKALTPINPKELELVEGLIEASATNFDPSQYHDSYRSRILERIEALLAGQPFVAAPQAAAPAPTRDLMAELEASIAAAKQKSKAQTTVAGIQVAAIVVAKASKANKASKPATRAKPSQTAGKPSKPSTIGKPSKRQAS